MEKLIELFKKSNRNGIAIIKNDIATVYSNFNLDKTCHCSTLSLQSNLCLHSNSNYLLTDEKILELIKIMLD